MAKKFKKLKNITMASFLAKITEERPRKRENNNYSSLPLLPDAKQKIPKNTIMATFQAKIGWKMMKKRENKNYHYISFLPEA